MIVKALMTAEQFSLTGPETDGCELVRGQVVPMPPPGEPHAFVCANVVFAMKSFIKQQGRGAVLCNDGGLITRRNPDSVRGVDVAVYGNPPWQGIPPPGYTDVPPDLAVEVRSPSERWSTILTKVGEYQDLGVRLVWIVDPESRRVTVFYADRAPATFAPENELDGGDVLPGFRCSVAEFFA